MPVQYSAGEPPSLNRNGPLMFSIWMWPSCTGSTELAISISLPAAASGSLKGLGLTNFMRLSRKGHRGLGSPGAQIRCIERLVFSPDNLGICLLIGVDQKRPVGDRNDANSLKRSAPGKLAKNRR